ncbi:MAG TPA: aminotransferase class III-fold pyridoxal phosphate-dependent enzyme [Acidobacteriota bacterium]|nr:aminotransferase class III-fold pyridoxal phosphate-dependent enzyme [Acidobacteriota bacterium]
MALHKNLLENQPRFNADFAVRLAKERYGIDAKASSLPSERDQNFLLQTGAGDQFVLKFANSLEDRSMPEAQQKAMTLVSQEAPISQRVIPDRSGKTLSTVRSESGKDHFVQLVTYFPGVPLAEVRYRSAQLLQDLGRTVGKLDRAMATFDHPAIHRDFHWDLATGTRVYQQYEGLIRDQALKDLTGRMIADYERKVAPILPKLRVTAIHNDCNDFNVIVRDQSVAGVIDFGDMVRSYTVGDLAVVIAYTILHESDPLTAAAEIVRGYNQEMPLLEDEIAALFGLICLRLCLSVAIAAEQQRQQPDNSYLAISQKAIVETLPKLAQIKYGFAEAVFRHACNRPPVAKAPAIAAWLAANKSNFAPILKEDLSDAPVFDLSVGSPLISGDPAQNEAAELAERLQEALKSSGARVGIGRYNEPRLLYGSPNFASGNDFAAERRTVHLGLDFFAEPGTEVHSPLAGTIHAFANNQAYQDHGPVIILRHLIDDGSIFYTLYGHLSVESMKDWEVGKDITKGEKIGGIGTTDINGSWAPHVHFQIITDLLDMDCDFTGVCRASQREIWWSFSPDPNCIAGIPIDRWPTYSDTSAETLRERNRYLGGNLSLTYKEPLKIERGWMQYLYSDTGRRYLDAYNNVPHVGHSHPRVVQAAAEQMSVLNTNTRYLHDNINLLAELICTTLPDPLCVCFLVNSGSEANELALRLARAHTGVQDVIALEAAYHGNTTTLVDISPYKNKGPGGKGPPSWVHVAPLPDDYRGPYKRDDQQAGEKYASHVQQIVERIGKPATFIAESCPSVGGQIILPDGYLREVYAAIRKAGGVAIADEIQTGYGRIGTHTWGFESQNVVPDIVTMGKPIGNGHPLGAVVTTREIAASFNNGMEFFSTFGGNTVSCAVGLAVLGVLWEEDLQRNALFVGNHMLEKLKELAKQFPNMGDVRGSGLFLGVELVRDPETRQPATEDADRVVNRIRDLGVLLGTDGPFENVLKIRPPMPFTYADANLLVDTLSRVLTEIYG